MKVTLIKTLNKIFIKSDYNSEFIKDIKKYIPVAHRRWNSASPMGFFYRLMTGMSKDDVLKGREIVENIKYLCDSGILKKSWEVDDTYYEIIKDICLKHFFEVYESEDGTSVRVIASEKLNYEEVSLHQENLLKEAENFRPGKTVYFHWNMEAETHPDTKKDDLNFQFFNPFGNKWLYATNFSRGPKREISGEIYSDTKTFKVTYSEDKKFYNYIWEGKFYCPKNTLFKFRGNFYLVIDENKLEILGSEIQGWSKAKQIEEYQKILIRLNEIKEDKIKIENLFKSKSFEIVDIEPSYQEPFIPEDAFEIIE